LEWVVFRNNHRDLAQNLWSAGRRNPWARPVAVPASIVDPSKIERVFVIIRENRRYDRRLGNVAKIAP